MRKATLALAIGATAYVLRVLIREDKYSETERQIRRAS